MHLIRSQNLPIPSALKITKDIRENIKQRITSHTIATPIHGIHLENTDSINLGNFKITNADRDILKDCISSADMIESAWKPMQHSLWLLGTIQGTSEYSQKKFISTARSTCALLSLVAATVLELGAARVSIQPELCGARGGAVSFMINNTTRELSLYREVGSPCTFQISEIYIDYITGNDWFYPLLEFLQNPPKTPSEIQKTLTRSIYWFYEAQSDPAPEMKLVKFWSCIECFYSFTKKEITQSIINGMIATLVFGGYKAYPLEAIPTLKKEIEDNYDLRSRAVHDAQHEHIPLQDVANVSRWAGFLVMELFSLSHQLGYTTRKEVKEQTDRLSKILARSKEKR
ncbi:hypothetical protein [Pseudomonas sp.]|uniref:hypothetical protein n=1 Tax=Pseudomonas sp. TaxID=306 RepID=UPI003D12FA17